MMTIGDYGERQDHGKAVLIVSDRKGTHAIEVIGCGERKPPDARVAFFHHAEDGSGIDCSKQGCTGDFPTLTRSSRFHRAKAAICRGCFRLAHNPGVAGRSVKLFTQKEC
jgi:hypothetical protein